MQGGEALENKAQTCKPVMGTRVRASKGAGTVVSGSKGNGLKFVP